MNHTVLVGRLTKDPETRYTDSGMAICTFTVAVDRPPKKDGSKEADFPRVKVFGRQAENCERYLAKGRLVGISGRIQTGSYTNREGVKVYTTDVAADRVEFLEWGERQGGQEQSYQAPQANEMRGGYYQPQGQATEWTAGEQQSLGAFGQVGGYDPEERR